MPRLFHHVKKIAPLCLLLTLLQGCLISEGGFEGEIYVLPGTSQTLHVGVGGCCYFIVSVPALTDWSVSPPTDGVSIEPHSGLLSIHATVPHNTVFTVSGGGASATVYVFDPEQAPLVNLWREIGQFDCETDEETTPDDHIEEIIFTPAGRFSVTWSPFEVYRDYWGHYTYNLEKGTVKMVINGGNYIPADFDGEGTFTIDEDGTVILSDLWFGTPQDYGQEIVPTEAQCGHRLYPLVY